MWIWCKNETSLSWNRLTSNTHPFELIKIYNRYNLVRKGDILIYLLFFFLFCSGKTIDYPLMHMRTAKVQVTLLIHTVSSKPSLFAHLSCKLWWIFSQRTKKVREKSRECHNHKPRPFPDPKRKRKPTNLNKHKLNKRTKRTKISSLFPKRGNRNTKRTEKHKNKMTYGKTYNKSPRRINHKATKSKTNTGTTALERSVEQKKVREKSRECHNHKPQPFQDPKRKRKPPGRGWWGELNHFYS